MFREANIPFPNKQTAENLRGPGPGRPKGSVNKTTLEIKTAIVEAFQKAGGVDYLVKLASDDPRTFCGLVGKVIPLQVTGNLAIQHMTKEQRDAAVAAALRADD